MEIHSIHLNNLRNDEHYQFGVEFGDLIVRSGIQNLNMGTLCTDWHYHYTREAEAMKKITKSQYTDEIVEASRRRDETFRGIADNNRSLTKHFKPVIKSSATRLQIVFDTYGNIADKPLTEKTGAYANLLEELQNKRYEADVTAVGLTEWVGELEVNNTAVNALLRMRTDEIAQRTDISLKEVRVQVDSVYKAIVQRILSYIIVDNDPASERKKLCETFIRTLNAIADRYNNIIATRRGKGIALAEQAKAGAEDSE